MIEQTMTFKKETKGTVVYEADGEAVSQVYVAKLGLPKPYPQRITLRIEAA